MTLFVVCLLTYAIKKTARDIWVIVILSVCIKLYVPIPDSGIPAAIGYAKHSGLPMELGIIVTSLLHLACTVYVSSPLVL